MIFTETRGNDGKRAAGVDFATALLAPVASFGGIYSPASMPAIDLEFLRQHLASCYKDLALALLQHLDIGIDNAILQRALDRYDRFDDPANPVPVIQLGERLFIAELYHGPTRAFKDMALQPFGTILSTLAQQREQQYLILTATSGDTGPAALETFREQPNIRVVCLYPDGGTSDVQRLQMVTEDAPNLKVIGIHGNFDDAQAALKSLLSSASFNQRLEELNISLSAANSVNFGRIVFQMLYQFHCYLSLVRTGVIELGERITLHIPSGNFGNALGAFYAHRSGLPINRIVIASNANNVLTEWIQTGCYDFSKRELIATNSPAMDILKSSNVERVLFELYGAERTRDLMQQLDADGRYQLDSGEHELLTRIFAADDCTDEEGNVFIRQAFERGYLLDPHTATCLKTCAAEEFAEQVNLVYSTAEWTKFAPVMDHAISGKTVGPDQLALASVAASAGVEIPQSIAELFDRQASHTTVVGKGEIESEILKFLEPA